MVPVTGALPVKGGSDSVALLASKTDATAHTVTGTALNLPRPSNGFLFELDVTAAAAAVGDTLDVKIQTSIDATNWIDVCYFTQILGNGGAKHIIASIVSQTAVSMFANANLTAGNVRHLFGDSWRVVYTVADGGAHGQSFTFGVNACPF